MNNILDDDAKSSGKRQVKNKINVKYITNKDVDRLDDDSEEESGSVDKNSFNDENGNNAKIIGKDEVGINCD